MPIERIDISGFAAGNCGVPFAFSLDSGRTGPVVTVLALTHGNEIAGAVVVAELLASGAHPQCGILNLIFANHRAYGEPGEPARRYVDRDLNRVWDPAMLEAADPAWELRRARELRPLLEASDYLLDLHTTATDDPPFLISTAQPAARRLVDQLSQPSHRVVFERPMHKGLLLIEACGFSDPSSDRVALVAECGHHEAQASVILARELTATFLAATGVLPRVASKSLDEVPAREAARPQNFFARRMVMARSETFRFARSFRSFDPIGSDEVFAWDGEFALTAGFADAVVLMPRLKPVQGGEAVLLAQAHRPA